MKTTDSSCSEQLLFLFTAFNTLLHFSSFYMITLLFSVAG